ncbi:hypothetical protein AMD24_00047 [Candidatus Xiphinematobacter sp. Idaho Grape]|nr:hypothetical protein AMD24_00047 [Candidatus Xiphinematobacter sp. Idaho Grape]
MVHLNQAQYEVHRVHDVYIGHVPMITWGS